MADFKKITEVPVVEEPNEGDTLMIVSDGELKQISASSFAAASGGSTAPLFIYGGSTAGRDAGYIYDPYNIGITTGAQVFEFMLSGGQVYWLGKDFAGGEITAISTVNNIDSTGGFTLHNASGTLYYGQIA